MEKNNKIDERIIKIKNDRYQLLNIVSDSIKNNRNIVISDIKRISDTLDYDEVYIKMYEAIVKAQELIASLTEEIVYAQTEQEIIAIRKKINYYINKIKSELKKRNIEDNLLIKYQESTNYLRKDIAKYLRLLKREDNIKEIETLNYNYETLSNEDKEKFRKMLNVETRYNQRNLCNKENNTPKTNKKNESNNINTNQEVLVPTNNETTIDIFKPDTQKKETIAGLDIDSFVDNVKNAIENGIISDTEYLERKVKRYNSCYHIDATYEYNNNSIFVDIVNMIKNIPIYKKNKKRIRKMEKESKKYYSGADLISYIAYLKKKNSIRQGLKSIFNRTYLCSNEGRLLNDHNECTKWLLNYCQKESLNINYLNRTKSI